MKFFAAIALACALVFASGCATLAPNADPVEVRAEQTVATAFETMTLFLKLELQHEEALRTKAPRVVAFAKWLTDRQADGTPRGVAIIKSANEVRRAYKLNRSAENRANLLAALAAVESALAETQKHLANSK